eukprot:749481-Hanusia_phi.AAC.9
MTAPSVPDVLLPIPLIRQVAFSEPWRLGCTGIGFSDPRGRTLGGPKGPDGTLDIHGFCAVGSERAAVPRGRGADGGRADGATMVAV